MLGAPTGRFPLPVGHQRCRRVSVLGVKLLAAGVSPVRRHLFPRARLFLLLPILLANISGWEMNTTWLVNLSPLAEMEGLWEAHNMGS